MIYLYIKTHNITGLKYLGKTESKDPFVYKGSGKYWKWHLKKYGYNITTEIIFQSENKEEFKNTSIYFSFLYDVVKSDEWANLTEENGICGGDVMSEKVKKEMRLRMLGNIPGNKGKCCLKETKQKISKSLIGNSYAKGYKHTEETKKIIAMKSSINNKNRKRTIEMKQKYREIAKNRNKLCCEYCGIICDSSNFGRWHGINCRKKE